MILTLQRLTATGRVAAVLRGRRPVAGAQTPNSAGLTGSGAYPSPSQEANRLSSSRPLRAEAIDSTVSLTIGW
jgi:hypothetical protein